MIELLKLEIGTIAAEQLQRDLKQRFIEIMEYAEKHNLRSTEGLYMDVIPLSIMEDD